MIVNIWKTTKESHFSDNYPDYEGFVEVKDSSGSEHRIRVIGWYRERSDGNHIHIETKPGSGFEIFARSNDNP